MRLASSKSEIARGACSIRYTPGRVSIHSCLPYVTPMMHQQYYNGEKQNYPSFSQPNQLVTLQMACLNYHGFTAAACFSLQMCMIGYAAMTTGGGGTGAFLCPGRCVGNGIASVILFDREGNAYRRGE